MISRCCAESSVRHCRMIVDHLHDWFEEFRLYHRRDGKVPPQCHSLRRNEPAPCGHNGPDRIQPANRMSLNRCDLTNNNSFRRVPNSTLNGRLLGVPPGAAHPFQRERISMTDDKWLRPLKLREYYIDHAFKSAEGAEAALKEAVYDGRIRVRHCNRILGPVWVMKNGGVLPPNVELSVEDARKVWP
jgi:hypothetical protein